MTARVQFMAVCFTCCVTRPLTFTHAVKVQIGGLP